MKSKPYPSWIWSKDEKSKSSNLNDEDFLILKSKTGFKEDEIHFLLKYYKEECEEEIKYFKNLEKK
jgi:hypothetical protein